MQHDLVYLIEFLVPLLIGLAFIVAWPLVAAALGPPLCRRIPLAARLAGGVAALVVFDLGLFTTLSFSGQLADELAVAAACVAFWLCVAGARAVLRWSVLVLWFAVLVAQANEVVPFRWQDSHDVGVGPPFRVEALPCGRVAELRTYGFSFTSASTQVTVLSHPLGGLLEHELGFEYFDADQYRPEELRFEPVSSEGCAAVLRYRDEEIWRVI